MNKKYEWQFIVRRNIDCGATYIFAVADKVDKHNKNCFWNKVEIVFW